jgi:signal transduction histidine kinase
MPTGGTINIGVHKHNEEQIIIRITDDGCGIPPDLLARVGEPFFTTKQNGTGLGMAVTHQIIESHGGRMLIESEIDYGTTVSVLLPIT